MESSLINIFKRPDFTINFDEVRGRHRHKLTDRNGASCRYPTFFNGENISGTVDIKLNSKSLKYKAIRAEIHGKIEKHGAIPVSTEFLLLNSNMAPEGEFVQEKTTVEFIFRNPFLKYESYKGTYASVKYFIRIIVESNLIGCSEEKEFAVVNPNEESILYENDFPIKLKVGVKNLLSLLIEFEHCNYNCRGVLKGFVSFSLVNANIKCMEVQLVKREVVFDGKKYEPEYIAKYELVDGGPTKNERIPLRFFLKSYNLTPSYPDIEGIFGVKYFLNLNVVDDNNNKYFKMTEINLHRIFRDRMAHLEDFDNNGLFVSEPFFENEYAFDPNTMINNNMRYNIR